MGDPGIATALFGSTPSQGTENTDTLTDNSCHTCRDWGIW